MISSLYPLLNDNYYNRPLMHTFTHVYPFISQSNSKFYSTMMVKLKALLVKLHTKSLPIKHVHLDSDESTSGIISNSLLL